jgi:outer membrane lipoprotein carrier protein
LAQRLLRAIHRRVHSRNGRPVIQPLIPPSFLPSIALSIPLSIRYALALLLALAAPAWAAREPAAPPDPDAPGLALTERLDALIERVKLEQKKLRTLEADFVQEKASEFLAAPETARGHVSFAHPDRVRWEYLAPKPISLLIRDDVMLTWYRDLGRAERVKVGRLSSQVFQYLNASGSLESLLRYFRANVTFPSAGAPADEPFKIELVPRFARVARRLASMTLWVDRKLFVPGRVRYVEPNGDVTEYRLDQLRVNGVIPEDRFVLELPADVAIREIDLDGSRARGASPQGGPSEPD